MDMEQYALYVLVEWPDSQEFMDVIGVRVSDESSRFVPIDIFKETLIEKNE